MEGGSLDNLVKVVSRKFFMSKHFKSGSRYKRTPSTSTTVSRSKLYGRWMLKVSLAISKRASVVCTSPAVLRGIKSSDSSRERLKALFMYACTPFFCGVMKMIQMGRRFSPPCFADRMPALWQTRFCHRCLRRSQYSV